MNYRIRRVSLRSALRVGLVVGWVIALIPAFPVALLATVALEGLASLLASVQPYELSFLGQPLVTIDPIDLVGLRPLAEWSAGVADLGGALFWLLLVLITLGGALLVMVGIVLVCLLYNLLVPVNGGLQVQLEQVAS
ncbi:MAG: hypothetical protein SNJ69_17190 [Chloroflexaceae bacterium]